MKEEEKRVVSRVLSLHNPSFLDYFLTSVHSVYCLVYCLYWGRLEVPRFWQCTMHTVTNLDDAIKINYDTSWLPASFCRTPCWVGVGQRLAEDEVKMGWEPKCQKQSWPSGYDGAVEGEGKAEKSCYGCGQFGHMTYAWGKEMQSKEGRDLGRIS